MQKLEEFLAEQLKTDYVYKNIAVDKVIFKDLLKYLNETTKSAVKNWLMLKSLEYPSFQEMREQEYSQADRHSVIVRKVLLGELIKELSPV